jgi:tyrosyl-tRNA synthetase
LYPGLQALDEEYLGVDAQFGGVDQRKIFTFAEKYMPALGYQKRIHMMNPMVPGLAGSKMSSSDPDSKIDLLDDPDVVKRKLRKAFCEAGNIEQNGLLSFAKFVLFPVNSLKGMDKLVIEREEKFGGNISFSTYQELEDAFKEQRLFPLDLKNGITNAINNLLAPIIASFAKDSELQDLVTKAYPVKKGNATDASDLLQEEFVKLNLKVGKISKVEKHPDADGLYITKVELGEETPRTVVAGMVKYFTPDQLLDRKVVVVANMKPAKLKGIESQGMILAATKENSVELLEVPSDCDVGEKVFVPEIQGEPEEVLNPKKKFLENVLSNTTTVAQNQRILVLYRDDPLMTSKGPCVVKSLTNAVIR